MSIVSVFFGIIIRMFYREHEPAHFHAEYQGQHGKFDFGHGNRVKMKSGQPLDKIPPLE